MLSLGTFWTLGQYVCQLVGAQRQDDGSYLYNLAGPGWRGEANNVPVEPDGTPWTPCDPSGTPLTPDGGTPLTD